MGMKEYSSATSYRYVSPWAHMVRGFRYSPTLDCAEVVLACEEALDHGRSTSAGAASWASPDGALNRGRDSSSDLRVSRSIVDMRKGGGGADGFTA